MKGTTREVLSLHIVAFNLKTEHLQFLRAENHLHLSTLILHYIKYSYTEFSQDSIQPGEQFVFTDRKSQQNL